MRRPARWKHHRSTPHPGRTRARFGPREETTVMRSSPLRRRPRASPPGSPSSPRPGPPTPRPPPSTGDHPTLDQRLLPGQRPNGECAGRPTSESPAVQFGPLSVLSQRGQRDRQQVGRDEPSPTTAATNSTNATARPEDLHRLLHRGRERLRQRLLVPSRPGGPDGLRPQGVHRAGRLRRALLTDESAGDHHRTPALSVCSSVSVRRRVPNRLREHAPRDIAPPRSCGRFRAPRGGHDVILADGPRPRRAATTSRAA